MDELRKEVAAVLPRRMKEHGDEVKREREERKKKLAALQVVYSMCSQWNLFCIQCTLKMAALQVEEGEGTISS